MSDIAYTMIGGLNMTNKQDQLLEYILKRVQDGKVDEAKKIVHEYLEKQEAGTFTRSDIGEFIPKMTMLLKPNRVDEVHDTLHEFVATFKVHQ